MFIKRVIKWRKIRASWSTRRPLLRVSYVFADGVRHRETNLSVSFWELFGSHLGHPRNFVTSSLSPFSVLFDFVLFRELSLADDEYTRRKRGKRTLIAARLTTLKLNYNKIYLKFFLMFLWKIFNFITIFSQNFYVLFVEDYFTKKGKTMKNSNCWEKNLNFHRFVKNQIFAKLKLFLHSDFSESQFSVTFNCIFSLPVSLLWDILNYNTHNFTINNKSEFHLSTRRAYSTRINRSELSTS